MSQVRKFAQGGGNPESSTNQTSTKHKPYRITIDGVVQELDDQDLANWANAYSTSTNNQQRTGLNDVINSIKRGNNVSYNSLKNTFTGVSWTNQDIIDELNANRTNPNQRQAERQKRRWERRDYRRGDARQQWMTGMQEAMRYNFNPQQEETTSKDNRTALYGDTSWFDYNTDDKGNVTFSTGPENADYLQRIQNFVNFLGLSEEDAANQYSWDGNEDYIRGLRAWAKTNNTTENPYDFNALIEHIKSNQLDANDLDLLRYMGFDKESKEDSTASSQQTVVPRSWEGSGFNDDLLEQNNYYVRQDKEGNIYLYTLNDNNELVPVQQNIYLKGSPWAQGTEWEGGAVYGGRLYNQNDVYNRNSIVGQAIQSQLFNQLAGLTNPEDIRQAALNSGWLVYGTENPFNISADNTFISGQSYLPGFTDIFNDGTYYWTDITNQYNAPEGTTILTYLNPNNRDRDNFLREQYAIYHNGQSQIFDSIEKLQNYLNRPDIGITQAEQYNYGNPIRQWGYTIENGTRYYDLGKRYIIPGNEDSTYSILRDNLGNYYVTLNNGQKQLLKGRAILEKIKNGTVTAQELQQGYAMEDGRVWQKTLDGSSKNTFFGINFGTKNKDPYEAGSYDQFFGFYKKGGKIESKQIGGLFSTGNYGKQKEYKPVESKIGAPQKLNADKRLKTSTDKAELTGGILDAAGLATSWIPGLGAAIGALGSLSHFVADVKKDGFQWSDAGKLAGNLALDALTFVPGAGFVAKATKTGVKAAKSADKVAKALNRIRPALATAGVVSGGTAIKSAVEDLQNDEFTSESMGKLLTGVGQATLGSIGLGKLYKTAKTIKNLNKTPIKDKFEVKPDDKKVKKAAKEVGNWVTKKGKQINQGLPSTFKLMYSPKKVESAISQNWEQLLKSDKPFNQKLAAEYLNKFGPQTSKGIQYSSTATSSFPWQNPKYEVKKDYISLIDARNIRAGRGILKKMARENISSLQDVKKYIKTNLSPEKQEIWNKYLDKKGGEFMRLIKKLSKEVDPHKRVQLIDSFKFKKGGIVKAQHGDWTGYWGDPTNVFNQTVDTRPFPLRVPTSTISSTSQPFTLVMNNTSTNPYFDYERGGIKFDSDGNVDWKATYDTNSDYMKYRKYYIDNWNNPEFQAAKQAYLRQLQEKGVKSGSLNISYIRTDPETGKSVSINPDAYDLNDPTISQIYDMSLDEFERLTNDKRLGYAHDLYNDAFGRIYKPIQSPNAPKIDIDSIEIPDEELQVDASSPITGSTDIAPVDYVDNTGKIIPDSAWSGLSPAKYIPKLRGWNPDDLIGGIELVRSLAMNTAMFNRMKDANKLIQKEMPTEIYDRYQDHITPIFNEQARNKRQFFVPTSTDALTNYAVRQTNEDAARQLEMEGKLRASEAYSQYLDKDLAARRAYAEDRRNTAFFNRQEMANKIMRDAQIDMQRQLANNQSIQNAVMELRNKLNQDWNRRQNFMRQEDAIKGAQAYDSYIKKYLADNGYNNQWNALSDEDKRTYGDIQNWLSQTNYSAWNDMMTGAGNARIDYMRGTYNNYLQYPWSRIRYAKKGTKTPTYQQRHNGPKPDEAIWINRNKETAKAIEKLHDAVIKLFMKSIS